MGHDKQSEPSGDSNQSESGEPLATESRVSGRDNAWLRLTIWALLVSTLGAVTVGVRAAYTIHWIACQLG